jgi:hypothetical protein
MKAVKRIQKMYLTIVALINQMSMKVKTLKRQLIILSMNKKLIKIITSLRKNTTFFQDKRKIKLLKVYF